MCDCDCDPPEFFNSKWVNGRKDYKCCECREPITTGQRHFMACGKWGGDFEVFRRCERCQRLCVVIEDGGHCVCYAGLYEEHGAHRLDFVDGPTADWRGDLERYYGVVDPERQGA